jgi:hypothetical protein
MPRIHFHNVQIQGPHFAKVQYASDSPHCSYIAEVELMTFNEVAVRFPPAVYAKPDDPVEFSEDDLQAILMMMLRCSVKVTGSRYESNSNDRDLGSRLKVFSLDRQ